RMNIDGLGLSGRLGRYFDRTWSPSDLGNHGVQPHREEVRFASGRKRCDQAVVSIGETEATVPLDFIVAAMPAPERISADAAYVTGVETLNIGSRFDPGVPRQVATSVLQELLK